MRPAAGCDLRLLWRVISLSVKGISLKGLWSFSEISCPVSEILIFFFCQCLRFLNPGHWVPTSHSLFNLTKFEHPISLTERSEMSGFLFYVAFRTQSRTLELWLYKKSGAGSDSSQEWQSSSQAEYTWSAVTIKPYASIVLPPLLTAALWAKFWYSPEPTPQLYCMPVFAP